MLRALLCLMLCCLLVSRCLSPNWADLLPPAAGCLLQLSTLTGLDTLVFGLNVTNYLPGLVACCASMTQLTFLELDILFFPECIENLTSLQHLVSFVFVGL